MNSKVAAFTLLMLMSLAVVLAPVALVFGQNQNLGVSILQVVPANTTVITGASVYNGTVGELFNLQGTIYTSGGSYKLYFGQNVVASGTANGYYVNANFSVPNSPSGSYPLTLSDLAINVNSTGSYPESFLILTGYYINAVTPQAQEGSNVVLNVTVTGGVPSSPYIANVSVVLPSPLNTVYLDMVSMGTSNSAGYVNAQVTYPGSNFQPSGSLSDYAGTYNVYFNQTSSLAQAQFSVGFLDSTSYHRGQTATVRATDYQPSQTASLNVTNTSGTSIVSQSLTASTDGVITSSFVVPSTATIGSYTVTITPQGTQKAIPDSQTFSVPGYAVQVTTVNLAGEIVPQISVLATDPSGTTISNSTSGANGVATLNLDVGTYNLTAFWNGANVGETNIAVSDNSAVTLSCQLTDLKITAQNVNGIALPFVNLQILYSYKTNGGSSQTGNISGQTGPSGSYLLNSTLTGIAYTVSASIYNQVFNSGNNTFNNIAATAQNQIVITCPNEALTINVVGNDKAAISGASIKLVESTNGLFYTATTDSSGSATSQVTFGMYKVQIYENDILINETTIQVFGATQQTIICNLYGIQVSVKVVDFFGSPISNANVTLNGPSNEKLSAMTKSDGTATFNNIVGGDVQIVAFSQGAQSSYQAVTLTVNNPTSVQIKMNQYIALGSIMLPVSSLITIIIVIVAIILLVTVEIYRRKKTKNTAES